MNYQEFSKEIIKASEFWDAAAKSACVDAVRLGTSEAMQDAKVYLARCDACEHMKNTLIGIIHKNWPLANE